MAAAGGIKKKKKGEPLPPQGRIRGKECNGLSVKAAKNTQPCHFILLQAVTVDSASSCDGAEDKGTKMIRIS